jgi:hypothetical protein
MKFRETNFEIVNNFSGLKSFLLRFLTMALATTQLPFLIIFYPTFAILQNLILEHLDFG